MATPPQKRHWMIGAVTTVAILMALGFVIHRLASPVRDHHAGTVQALTSGREVQRSISEIVELPAKTVEIMNLRTVPAIVPRFSRVLRLRGSLAIDPNRLVHVHARFPGQIVELATTQGMLSQIPDPPKDNIRPLQTFDNVKQSAPMAMVWSKDLGEKKSQLAEALAKLRLDNQTLTNYLKLSQTGAISDRDVREQRAQVELGNIAAFTAEQTLRSYQVSEDEIEAVKAASEMIHLGQKTDKHFASGWPRVMVTAPISGMIVDKTMTVGEIIDTNAELFKIADLSVLAIWLHAYEEDLPALQRMQFPLPVDIQVPANPDIGELHGYIDRVGPIIDPNEHMALLIGTVKNPENLLRVGQFITGEVGIPSQEGVVEIPSNALIDVGNGAVVYVQPDKTKPVFERRRVDVVQRHFDFVQVRSELSAEQKELGLREIQADDPVVSGGVLELEEYQSQH